VLFDSKIPCAYEHVAAVTIYTEQTEQGHTARQTDGLDCSLLGTIAMHYAHLHWWWSGVVVSVLSSINKVNQRQARLVLRWVTISGFNSR